MGRQAHKKKEKLEEGSRTGEVGWRVAGNAIRLWGRVFVMGLAEYKRRRDFQKSPEPMGSEHEKAEAKIYLIHRHEATHLHWDLRLEMDGVLKSWAVPKEPPTQPGTRRLAVQVEDHPLEYAGFSGVIPEGEYGAGTVEIWDKGSYTPVSIKEDKLVIMIQGERLKGNYVLVKTRLGGKGNNWLFFKMKDRA
jgi:DNA ligase D-like protein (predicted 3'-phosphoesterase)